MRIAEHGRSEFVRRAAQFPGARGVAFLHRFAFDAVFDVLDIELKTRVAFIVDGHALSEVVAIGFLEAENIRHAVM